MRVFPKPDLDVLKAFVIHTNLLERLPMNTAIVETAIKEGKEHGDPLAVGQFSAINIVLSLSPDDAWLPAPTSLINELDSHDKLKWLRDLHSALMTPIANLAEKKLDPNGPPRHQIGTYRSSRKTLGHRVMPSPLSVRRHLHELLRDVAQFNKDIALKLKNPFMLSKMDIQAIADQAYTANLRICCIKPFEDGSNRLGRLVENALRLHWGLPWKIISADEKDTLLSDIFKIQDARYSERS